LTDGVALAGYRSLVYSQARWKSYKNECKEILRRFLARELSYVDTVPVLDAVLADFRPKLTANKLASLWEFIAGNNGAGNIAIATH
jgi:hypothetical protein